MAETTLTDEKCRCCDERVLVERKAYAIEVKEFDFGLLNARNQLISKVINPALDTLLLEPVHDHIVGSETTYSLTIYLKSERAADDHPEIQ